MFFLGMLTSDHFEHLFFFGREMIEAHFFFNMRDVPVYGSGVCVEHPNSSC